MRCALHIQSEKITTTVTDDHRGTLRDMMMTMMVMVMVMMMMMNYSLCVFRL